MKQIVLSPEQVLMGYDAISALYPNIPPLCLWRAWEYAAYQRYTLSGPVLDVGCGDGRFFRSVWPQVREVVGVDQDPRVADAARRSGVYAAVDTAPAHQLPGPPARFASAFANCSLEHMDHLPEVLSSIHNALRPNGEFLLSVVTDRWLEWATLPLLLEKLDLPQPAQTQRADYVGYHHVVNAFSPARWAEQLTLAGFEVLDHIPIVPELTGRLFLFLDHVWHAPQAEGELGATLQRQVQRLPDFPLAFRRILHGVLTMEPDWSTGSGAVFWTRKL